MNPTALITGASTGIGVSLSKLLAQKGYDLILMARRIDLLSELKDSLLTQFPDRKIIVVSSDVAQHEKHMQDIKTACSQFSQLDLVIANAGIGGTTNEWTNTWQKTSEMLNINLLGAIATIEAAKDIFLKQGFGHIVGVTSVAATRGFPQSSAYCSSKAGLEKFLESMRIDLIPYGIAVTAIHPGFVATPMTAKNGSMPWLMSSEKAAEHIWWALEKKRARLYFPWQMNILMVLLRTMPHRFFDFLMRRGQRKISGFRKEHG